MAYGLKYIATAYGLSDLQWKLEIYEKDFTPTEGSSPVSLSLVGDGLKIGYDREEDRFNTIYSRYVIIDLKVTEFFNLDTLQFDDERKFWIKIYRNNNFEFSGWIIPNYSSQAYEDVNIVTISIQAKDSINRLRDIPFVDEYPTLFSHKQSVKDLISQSLRNIGYNLDLEIYYNKYEDEMLKTSSDCPLSQLYVNIKSFRENDEWISYYDIIQRLLSDHDLRIFQANGKWIVLSPIELVDGNISGRKFNYLGEYQSNVTLDSDLSLGLSGLGIKRNSIIRKGIPIQSFTANFEFGQSRNVVLNGGMENFSDFQPEGWTLSDNWVNGEVAENTGGGIIFRDTYATRSPSILPDVPVNDASLNQNKYLESDEINIERLGTFSLSAETFISEGIDAARVRIEFYDEGGVNKQYIASDGKLTLVPTSLYVYNDSTNSYKLLTLTWENKNQYATPVNFKYMKVRVYEGIRLRSGVPETTEVKFRNISISGRPIDVSGNFIGKRVEIKNTELQNSKKYSDLVFYYKDVELFNEPEHVHKLYLSDEIGEASISEGKWKRTSESIQRKLIDSKLVDRLSMTNRFGDIFEGSIYGYVGMDTTPYLEIDEKRFLVLYSEFSLGINTSEIVAIELFANDFNLEKKEYNLFSDNTVIEVDGDSASTTKIDIGETFDPITDSGGTFYGGLYTDKGIDAIPSTSTDPRATNKGILKVGSEYAEYIELGNRANDTLVEVLGRFGLRNEDNFLAQFSVADLTDDRLVTLPDRDIEVNKWADLSGVPTSFTPSAHFHTIGEVTGLSDALAAKQPLNAILTALTTLTGNGIVRKTNTSTFVIGTNDAITLSGDVTGTGTTAITTTLANSGVTAGTYRSITVDAKGRVTAGTNPTTISEYEISDFWEQTLEGDFTPLNEVIDSFDSLREIAEKAQGQLSTKQSKIDLYSGYDEALYNGVLVTDGGFLNWKVLDSDAISNFSSSVLGQVLTEYSIGVNTPITSSNTILTGLQNLQAQTSANATSIIGLQTQITTNASRVSGTINYITKFTAGNAIGNSIIFDNGTFVGINTTSPSYTFDVNGSTRFFESYLVGTSAQFPIQLVIAETNHATSKRAVTALGAYQIISDLFADSSRHFGIYNTNDGNTSFFISNNSNVGINTVNPGFRLDVNGTGRFTGIVQFDSIPTCSVAPTASNHLTNKAYVDSLALIKRGDTVKTISLTTLTKSGLYAVNGYTLLAGDLVLDAGGTSGGGVWVASSGSWSRSTTNDSDSEIRGAYHLITAGTYANSRYINTNTSTVTVGTTALTYDVDFGAETDPVWNAYKTANDLTPTRFGNWNTAFGWGNHANLYVDKVSTQSDIGGAKKFTTSIQSPIVKGGTDALGITISNYFGTAPRIASSATMDFFATTDYIWYTTGDLGRMRLTTTGLRVGSSSAPDFTLQVSGTTGLGGLLSVVYPLDGTYSSGSNGQVLMRRSVSSLNYNAWTTLTVSHISDIATYYQAKITGTENYLTKKTSTNFGDSQIFDNGTSVVIGGTSAIDSSKFSVVGKIGATTFRVGDNTDGINIGSLAINSTGALAYGATSHTWNVSSTEKLNLSSTKLALTGDFELSGRIKVSGSFGADHYFLKSNGTTQEFAEINCGEISDIADLYLSIEDAEANYIKRVTDQGEKGFFLYGDDENTIKEGFMFTNPDTGIMGIHAFRLNGTTVEQYGFQLDKDGLPYWLYADGSRKRILTENDALGSGGGGTVVQYTLAEPLYFLGTQINIRTATASQTGALSFAKFSEFDAKLGQGSTVSSFLNYGANSVIYFEKVGNTTASAGKISVYNYNGGADKDLVLSASGIGADIALLSDGAVIARSSSITNPSIMGVEVDFGANADNSILKFNGTNINWKLNTTPTNGQKFLVQYDSSKNTFFFVPA